jgi:endonuclease/exonuclease/phosphatase family metal-dependent hydrolase
MWMILLQASVFAAASPVIVDGEFTDWPSIDNAGPGLVGAASHNSDVFLLLALDGTPVNLQGLDEPLTLRLDWDNRADTGIPKTGGIDIEVTFSPRRRGLSVRTAKTGQASWDSVNIVFAPTVANDRFEIRLPRTLPSGGPSAGTQMAWQLDSGENAMTSGTLKLRPIHNAPKPALKTAIPPSKDGAIRVMTWNLEFGNVLKQAPVVRRVLKAVQPHIVLFQELEHDQTAEAIKDVLAATGDEWTVEFSPFGGRIRSGIASRLPAKPVAAFKNIKRRGESHGHVRAAALEVDVPGGARVLAVSTHLKCCGSVGGPEDMKRIAEVTAIRRAVEAAEEDRDFHGLIIGGDLNLVGGRLPLEMLVEDGESLIAELETPTSLAIIDAWQPDGRGRQTWQKSGSSYSPGRLDYIVVSSRTLKPTFSIIIDTLDLPESALRSMDLVRTDTRRASDHLPVIVDLQPITPTK